MTFLKLSLQDFGTLHVKRVHIAFSGNVRMLGLEIRTYVARANVSCDSCVGLGCVGLGCVVLVVVLAAYWMT